MLCFLLILTGCTNRKISREFSHTMDDGGRVNIKIEYKPKSQISGDKKFGSYYYIVQYFYPKTVKRASEQQGKAKTADDNPFMELVPESREQQSKTKTRNIFDGIIPDKVSREQQSKTKTLPIRYIRISFYDQKGYSLLSRGTFAPGWNHNADEVNLIDGGWEWKGRFDESYITVENFRDIYSIKVTYVH